MRTTANMRRKESEFLIYDCVIEKVVVLPETEYRHFLSDMLKSQDFIRENVDIMYAEHLGDGRYMEHCLLVMGEESEDGVMVQSEGADYARYASYQPNVRSYLKEQIQKVAEGILAGQFSKPMDGVWMIGWDDIKEHFDVSVSQTNGIGEMLVAELSQREEVAEIIATEDGVEMSLILEQNENADIGDVLSVVGCNLGDEAESEDEAPIPGMNL